MADDLTSLENWIEPLIKHLAPGQKRKMNRALATGLRKRQAARIASQKNPDGTAFAPRKARKFGKQGRIKRKAVMFHKLRQARHLKISADAERVEVGYKGKAARIAQIHQEGLLDRVSPGGPLHRYPVRQLLGLNQDDRDWVFDQLQSELNGL